MNTNMLPNTVIFDVEIEKAILGRNETIHDDIEYCGGWEDFTGMGIAVVCAYDYQRDIYRTFGKKDTNEMNIFFKGADLIVGFNNHRFDNPLLQAHGVTIERNKSYDILEQISRNAGTMRGYSLVNVAKSINPDYTKDFNGALAPILWQRGRQHRVIDYCLNDVWLTKKVLGHIIEHQKLPYADDYSDFFEMPSPLDRFKTAFMNNNKDDQTF